MRGYAMGVWVPRSPTWEVHQEHREGEPYEYPRDVPYWYRTRRSRCGGGIRTIEGPSYRNIGPVGRYAIATGSPSSPTWGCNGNMERASHRSKGPIRGVCHMITKPDQWQHRTVVCATLLTLLASTGLAWTALPWTGSDWTALGRTGLD